MSFEQKLSANLCNSSWFTTVNKILRMYVAYLENFSKILETLMIFIRNVFEVIGNLCAQHLHQSIILSHYLLRDLKNIIDNVIRRNGLFGHPENILISMLTSGNRTHIRQQALQRIVKVWEIKWSINNEILTIATSYIRIFKLPAFDLLRQITQI